MAAERTLLAWIRTGLALMGFGFVLARFGIFLQSLSSSGVIAQRASPRLSVSSGIILIAFGVPVEILALASYRRLFARLRAGQQTFDKPSTLGSTTAILMAAFGIAMATYLLVFR